MSNANSFEFDAEPILNFLNNLNIEDLVINEERAQQTRQEILDAIPRELRGLYPEDDTLAAFAFAPIFYMLKYGG